MKVPKGYFSFGWFNTYYFLEEDYDEYVQLIAKKDILKIADLACLELDSAGHCVASRWPGEVRGVTALKKKIKLMNN